MAFLVEGTIVHLNASVAAGFFPNFFKAPGTSTSAAVVALFIRQ
jgi:hypothetical protein